MRCRNASTHREIEMHDQSSTISRGLHAVILATLLALFVVGPGEAEARKRLPVPAIINTGDIIHRVADIPPALLEENADFEGWSFGYKCSNFGVLWASVWTWGCELVAFEENVYADIDPTLRDELALKYPFSEADRSFWNKYGMLMLLGLGFAGMFVRERNAEIQVELDDAIEHRNADSLGTLSSHIGSTRQIGELKQKQERQQCFDQFMDKMYRLATTDQYAAATALLIDRLHEFGGNLELYTDVYNRLSKWPPNRLTMNFARIYITELVTYKFYSRALDVCKACYDITPEFRLGDPTQVLPLAQLAKDKNLYELAYALLKEFDVRYPGNGGSIQAHFIAVQLLWEHLSEPEQARRLLTELLQHRTHPLHKKIVIYASLMSNTQSIA